MAPLEDALALPDEERVESQLSAYAVCVAHFRLSPEERELYGQLPIGIYGDQGLFFEYNPFLIPIPHAHTFAQQST
jgi:sarcosine oxidase/L-pipecolate oxidase